MRVLAIETATAVGSVALLDGPTPMRTVDAEIPMRHLEWLAPAIERVLADQGWALEMIEGIAVSRGPGTFTGLRIGIATAAALAHVRHRPIVGVSTLAAIALGVETHGLVCVLLDVRRGEVATALFRRDGGLTRLTDDLVAPIDGALAALRADEPVTFIGDGLERYGPAVHDARGDRAILAPRTSWAPRASAVGRLAWERLVQGERDDPYTLLPIYGRQPVVTDVGWRTMKEGTASLPSEWK